MGQRSSRGLLQARALSNLSVARENTEIHGMRHEVCWGGRRCTSGARDAPDLSGRFTLRRIFTRVPHPANSHRPSTPPLSQKWCWSIRSHSVCSSPLYTSRSGPSARLTPSQDTPDWRILQHFGYLTVVCFFQRSPTLTTLTHTHKLTSFTSSVGVLCFNLWAKILFGRYQYSLQGCVLTSMTARLSKVEKRRG